MPQVLHQHCFEPGELGLWQIEESENWLRERVDLHPAEVEQLDRIKGEGRRREFLAARLLLHYLSGREQRGALLKDEFGKPRLLDSDYHISISHTSGLSAAFGHPQPCGVDVQVLVPKIHRLAPRFINDQEEVDLRRYDHHQLMIGRHLIWSAKEAVYKAYGRRELDFKQHLTVDLSEWADDSGFIHARLRKELLQIDYRLYHRMWAGRYMLVVAVEAE